MYMCVYPERVPRAHGPTIVPLSSRRSSARTAEAAATANPMGKAAVRAMPRARMRWARIADCRRDLRRIQMMAANGRVPPTAPVELSDQPPSSLSPPSRPYARVERGGDRMTIVRLERERLAMHAPSLWRCLPDGAVGQEAREDRVRAAVARRREAKLLTVADEEAANLKAAKEHRAKHPDGPPLRIGAETRLGLEAPLGKNPECYWCV